MTTTRHLLRSALIAAAAFATLTAGHASSIELADYSAPDRPGCVAIPITHVGEDQVYACDQYQVSTDGPDRVADCLTAMGFHGRPDDQSETIYATAEQIEWCASDPAGMYRYGQSLESGTWAV